MPSSHLILGRPLLLLPPIPPSIRVSYNESTLRMRGPKYWSFSFSIIPSKEIPGLISFRMDWLDLLEVQGTHKSLLQHHFSSFKSINSLALSFLHKPTLTSIHDNWKNLSLYAGKFGKLSSGHRTGKGQFSFRFQRKAMQKNAQTTTQLHSYHTLFSKPGFSNM